MSRGDISNLGGTFGKAWGFKKERNHLRKESDPHGGRKK